MDQKPASGYNDDYYAETGGLGIGTDCLPDRFPHCAAEHESAPIHSSARLSSRASEPVLFPLSEPLDRKSRSAAGTDEIGHQLMRSDTVAAVPSLLHTGCRTLSDSLRHEAAWVGE
jgi:hypothetical protein